MPNSMIRQEARRILQGNWVKVAVIMFVCSFLSQFFTQKVSLNGKTNTSYGLNIQLFGIGTDGINGGLSLLSSCLSLYLTLGTCAVVLALVQGREYSIGTLFQSFSTGIKAIGLGLVMSIFVVLWSLLLIVPGIIKMFSYSMSFYVLAQNPDMSIMECISESKHMMEGKKMNYFLLQLSFIGYYILLGIAMLIPSIIIGVTIGVAGSVAGADVTVNMIIGIVSSIISLIGGSFVEAYRSVASGIFYLNASGQVNE